LNAQLASRDVLTSGWDAARVEEFTDFINTAFLAAGLRTIADTSLIGKSGMVTIERCKSLHRRMDSPMALLRCLAAGFFSCALMLSLQAAEPDPPQWAVVAADGQSAALADLLTAEITQWHDVRLLERSLVKHALGELKLQASGLVTAESSVRFGKSSHADALVLIESKEGGIRVRLIETRTGVRLADFALPQEDVAKDVEAVARELQRRGAKLTIALDKRHLVGILALRSEEPGDALTGNCQTITTLLDSELQRRPNFVVLEREQLQKLADEKELTGVELALRSAAWLLEAGVRRTEGNKGLVITGQLHSPSKEAQYKLRVVVATQDVAQAASELAKAVEKALGQPPFAVDNVELKAEAALFSRRRVWADRSYRMEEAAQMADAALALAPTNQNLEEAISAYGSCARGPKTYDALVAARRMHELRLQWWSRTEGAPMERVHVLQLEPFEPHVRITAKTETAEERSLRDEVDQLAHQFYDVSYLASGPEQRWDLLLHRLRYLAYHAHTEKHYAVALPGVIADAERLRVELSFPADPHDERYGAFAKLLVESVLQSQKNVQRGGWRVDQREWKLEGVVPLWRQLSADNNPAIRAAGLAGLTTIDEEADSAAMALLEIVQHWPRLGFQGGDATDRLVDLSLSRCQRQKADAFIDRLIAQAKADGSDAALLRFPSSTHFYAIRLPKERKKERIEALLARLDSKSSQLESINMRNVLVAHLEQEGLVKKPDFSVADGEGPWQHYVTRAIVLRKPADAFQLVEVVVDERPEASELGGEIVLVWTKPHGKMHLQRVPLLGGAATTIGGAFTGFPKPFLGVQLAFSKDATFVASDAPGFTVLRDDEIKVYDEQAGAPSSDVHRIAWCNDRLYVGYRDALACFDPREKTFELIASSLAIEPRNELDGRGSFHVNAMLADETTGNVWFNVQDNALPRKRNGLWRYDTKRSKLEHVDGQAARLSQSADGLLMHHIHPPLGKPKHEPWLWLDVKQARLTSLAGYASHRPPKELNHAPWRFVKVGDHLISSTGQLYTPAGEVHRVKLARAWKELARAGDGFLTHYDESTQTLWHVAPRR
jgi:hypothetical protein